MFSVLFAQVLIATQYMNVASFYPLFVEAKYGKDTINSTMVSVAMCSFEFAGFACSFFNRRTIAWLGKKNAISFGFALSTSSVAGMGALAFISAE